MTHGLQSSANPTTDKLTPQETTSQDAPDMGVDGGDLSRPGSSEVAQVPPPGKGFSTR